MMLPLISCYKQQEQSNCELPLPRTAFRVDIRLLETPESVKVNSFFYVTAVVKNKSLERWPSLRSAEGKFAVVASYIVRDQNNKQVKEGGHTMLPDDLQPGEKLSLDVSIKAPEYPGRFKIVVDLLHEGVGWFTQYDTSRSPAIFEVSVIK